MHPKNLPNENLPEGDQPQSFSQFNVVHNGQTYSNMNELPPELKEKLDQAMNKLKSNPGLFNMIGAFTDLAKTANQIGAVKLGDFKNMNSLQNIINGTPESKIETQVIDMTGNSATSTPTKPQMANSNIDQVTHMKSDSYSRYNEQRNFKPTFNPDVKNDNFRRNIFLLGLAIIGFYLVYTYVWNGQLPF